MAKQRMYEERKANISVFRGCNFNCCYCAFRNSLKRSKCGKDREFKPHSHLEVLRKTAPRTKSDEFVTIGLTSDISFMDGGEFYEVLEYCHNHPFTTFLIQSKNPIYFSTWKFVLPRNVIFGTTIESNRLVFISGENNLGFGFNKIPTCLYDRGDGGFEPISQAPGAFQRYEGMLSFQGRKSVTIEPIMDFDIIPFASWILNINPEIVWIGYDSHPEKNRLIEPTTNKVDEFVNRLKDAGINVKLKLIREPIRTGGK